MIGLVLGLLPVLLLPRLPDPWVPLPLATCGLLLLCGRRPCHRLCAGLALGCALALVHGQLLLQGRLAVACVGRPLTLTGEVTALPRVSLFPDGTSRQRFEFTVHELFPADCSGPQQILLSYYGPAKIIPGDTWTFPVKLSRPWGLANPGSFNLQAWYAQTGIHAVGNVSGGRGVRQPARAALSSLPGRLRQDISERIAALPLEKNVAAILAAVTVADKSGIDTSLWQLFQQFGINHLLVISGLHVGLVAGAAYFLGRWLQRLLLLAGVSASWIPAALALACCSAYTALAGFSVATQRALCMLFCFIVASLAGRSSSPGNTLLLAAVVVLGLNPLAALGSGFWLSFSAVAVLLWLSRWQRGRQPWQRVLATHGFMCLAMLPLGAWWFGGASVVAGFANLLMVPLVGMVVVPAALLAVVAIVGLPWAEKPLWQLAAWPLQQLLPIAKQLSDNGGAWFYQQLPAALPEVLLAALGVALLVTPVSWYARALAALMVLPLALPLDDPARYPRGEEPAGLTRVTVLDVGQGTSVLVQAGDRTLAYDTGGGDPAGANMANAVLLPYLRQRGTSALDTLVISHADNDHSAGARTLLAAMPTARVYYGGRVPGLARGRPCVSGHAWRWPGGQRFQFLSPAGPGARSSNDNSCVLHIEAGGRKLLLAGDVENAQERELVRYWGTSLASDWLLVAHHGSRTSSSYALLKAVQPGIAVLSSGYANRFGHPHGEVIDRLSRMGVTIYSTATGGALEFELVPGQPVRVTRRRDQVRRFWM
jgi:competence protein ComEC